MTPDDTRRTIAELDAALSAEDPEFAARYRRTIRRSMVVEIASFVLLAAGAVLATTGLAVHNSWLLAGGAGALISSAALTTTWRRTLFATRAVAIPPPRRRHRCRRSR